jgi:hypothetical protein
MLASIVCCPDITKIDILLLHARGRLSWVDRSFAVSCSYGMPVQVIDGVLIPASLAANYSLADVPGATNITAEETTAAEPTGAATGTKGPAEAPATTTPPSSPPSKSSAGTVAAALLAAPVLLAVIML